VNEDAFIEPSPLHPVSIQNTMRWVTLIERWMPDFEDTLDVPLVLSVILKESKGDPHAVDESGLGDSVGVMQVIPKTWIPCYSTLVSENGKDEYGCQIYAGMWLLDKTIIKADGDIRYALAAYNCSFVSVDADNCYPWGGYVYADIVLDVIYPVMLEEYENYKP